MRFPMPVVIKTRTYDDDFFQAMRGGTGEPSTLEEAKKDMDDLFY